MVVVNKRGLAGFLPYWQLLFLLLSTTWLLAPRLNNSLSARTALISQYEVPSQPFAWLFRSGDFLGGGLLFLMGFWFIRVARLNKAGKLVGLIGLGMLLDPIFSTTCRFSGGVCIEQPGLAFYLHATETTVTAAAVFGLALYDSVKRRKLLSATFAGLQIGYFILLLTQYATTAHINTISQYAYQLISVAWLAWYCRDRLEEHQSRQLVNGGTWVKYGFASWTFLNGLLAIVLSLRHLALAGHFHGLYFAGDTAWLAQHGVFVGVIMIYLSRHIARGERRARQILLIILLIESLKYAVIAPSPLLVALYFGTFCLLFAARHLFDRGTIALTWQARRQELFTTLAGLSLAGVASWILLDRDDEISRISYQALNNFTHYGWSEHLPASDHLRSVLLAHTISAFIIASSLILLWIIFRPAKNTVGGAADRSAIQAALLKYSNSTEDYFKYWPLDKQYFRFKDGFIAYKVAGPIAFALADPIAPLKQRQVMIEKFIMWARDHRLRACFLPVHPARLKLYESAGLTTFKVGSSAVINRASFINYTAKDKWWRWQQNRSAKAGYVYAVSDPPHSRQLLNQWRKVSDAWLGKAGRKERGLALGHFDAGYLQACRVHYLSDASGEVIAFTNQVPNYTSFATVTVDLLRHQPKAANAMPFLLLKTIESLDGYREFDLGFVPFAAVDNIAIQIAKVLSGARFSATGLEQFKNKFDPNWVANYICYDGDLADLALVGLNLERAMELE